MALTPETEAQILRYHHAERWPVGTIARQLNLHRDSVARVLAQAGLPAIQVIHRPSAVDPYLPVHSRNPRTVSPSACLSPLRDGQGIAATPASRITSGT
jgi:hypothetical protein